MQEKADLGKGSVTYPFPVFETEKMRQNTELYTGLANKGDFL